MTVLAGEEPTTGRGTAFLHGQSFLLADADVERLFARLPKVPWETCR